MFRVFVIAILFSFGLWQCKIKQMAVPSLTPITKTAVLQSISFLANDTLQGRVTGSKGADLAASYLEKELQKAKIAPFFTSYRDSFMVSSKHGYNVIGYIPGTDATLQKEFVVLGAHYDHIKPEKSTPIDSIANGANDNATGTTALLHIVKQLKLLKNNKRSILIAFFAAEEMGLKGSIHLARRLKKQDINIYTMLNFEMLGVPMQAKKHKAYVTGYTMSNVAKKWNSYAKDTILGYLPMAKKYQLFKRSDNYPFFNEFHIPAHTISTFDFTNYPYYHHVLDHVEALDITHMTSFINQAVVPLQQICNTTEKEIQLYE